MSEVGGLRYWKNLAASAAAGEVELDPTVADDIRTASEEFIAGLQSLREQALRLGNISGVGGLDSAKELAQKFEQKAVGSNGFVEHYEQMIEIVTLISETVSHSVKELAITDEAIGASIPGVGGN